MRIALHPPHSPARATVALALLGAVVLTGCIEEAPGLSAPEQARAGSAGRPANGGAGNEAGATGAGTSVGGAAGESTHDAAGHAGDDGQGGSAASALGGAGGAGEPVLGGAGSGGEDSGVHITPACPFESAPVPGAGGEPSTLPDVTLQLSPFVGSYLADATGRTLYTYGADLPGDCNTPPQSGCSADCLVSWPPFDAGARVLPPELTDAGFGTIERAEGGQQTTYMGWPLYFYKADTALGQMTGQGKGKLWHVAELVLPSITIMKAGAVKYLADGAGRTLYVSSSDQSGSADSDPVSNCSGDCLDVFEGFRSKNLSLVSSLEPLDFSMFVRHGSGGLQVAYKGLPLYRAASDLKAGDMTGTAVTGFTAAIP